MLLLGEGNGRFLHELLRRNSAGNVTCVDASAGMHAAAQRRLQRAGCDTARVSFLHADALACDLPNGAFDAVVTNFFLDCFPPAQLERVIHRIADWAAPQARWVVSDFQSTGRGARRWRANLILAVMYLFFQAATRLPARSLTDPRPFLMRHGFLLAQRHEREWGLLYSELWVRKSAGSAGEGFPAPAAR